MMMANNLPGQLVGSEIHGFHTLQGKIPTSLLLFVLYSLQMSFSSFNFNVYKDIVISAKSIDDGNITRYQYILIHNFKASCY